MTAFSLLLVAIGAILTFAINVAVDGAELGTIGVILMAVGAIGFVAGLFTDGLSGFRSTTTRHVSEDGDTVVEEKTSSSV